MSDHGLSQGGPYVLQNATVMLGPLGEGENLNPDEHSIGLFKEATLNVNQTFKALTQGVRETKVDEQMVGQEITFSGKGYEFGAKQIAYALGQDGHGLSETGKATATTLAATVNSNSLTVADPTGYAVGDNVVISPSGDTDACLVAVVTAINGSVFGLDRSLSMPIPVGSRVTQSRLMLIGGDSYENTFKSMKVTSAATNGDPLVMVFAKVKVTSSFTLAMSSADYASIPFNFQSYAMTPNEAGFAQYRARNRAELWMLARA